MRIKPEEVDKLIRDLVAVEFPIWDTDDKTRARVFKVMRQLSDSLMHTSKWANGTPAGASISGK